MIPQFSGYFIGRSDFTSSSIHSNYKYPHVFPPQLIKRTWHINCTAPSTILCHCKHISFFKLDQQKLGLRKNLVVWKGYGNNLWGRFSMGWETLMDTMHATTQILLLALINAMLSVNLICQIFLSIKTQKWPWTVK